MSDNIKLLKNYLLYFLVGLLICMVGISNVFAAYTYEDIGYFTNQTQVQVSVNYTSQPLTLTKDSNYQLEQVYSLDMNISNINLVPDFVYYFEIYLPGTILTNANMAQVINTSGSNPTNCSIISTYFINEFPHVTFKCDGSSNITSLYIKYYNSNNQYLFSPKLVSWNYTYMRKRVPDSSDNTGEIKDALNQQTEDIINNQNTNTDRIIEENNKNFNTCKKNNWIINDIIMGDYTNQNNTIRASSRNSIYLDKGSYIFTTNINLSTYGVALSILPNTPPSNSFNSLIDFGYVSNSTTEINVTQSGYLVLTIKKNNNQTFSLNDVKNSIYELETKNEICTNKLDSLNDSINDDDIGDSTQEAADFITDFDTDTFGLTSIITAPLNLIQSLTSSTCTALHLPLPYLNNKYLDLPCMTTIYQTHFGAFFTMYQTITYGIIAYWVIVRIFNQVKDFKNPEHDEIEVVDL